MKTKLLLGLLLFSTLCFAERKTVSSVITVNGDTVTFDNVVGGMTVSIGEVMTGAPSTVSVVVQGCKIGAICATLDTNTSVGNAIRNITVTTVYDYFLATAAWTGGTSVSIGFNYTTTTARTGGNQPGGAVNSVFGRAGDVVAASNDYSFAQLSGKPTTVGGYGITDAVPTTRTVNGHALSANVTVTASDVGNGTAQWNANLLNGVSLAGLGTGLLKNTTGTGVPSIATGADIDALFTGAGKCYLFKGTTPGTNDGCDNPGGSGTVTNFSAGDLSPLFTTTETTTTSTPALSFSLATAAANTVFGNFTGSPAVPTFTAAPTFSAANLTNFPTFNQNTSGTAANLSGTPALPNGTTGTTQTAGDNTAKLATDAFVLANTLTNPMTTLGDLSTGGASGTPTRLAGPTATNGVPQTLQSTPSAGAATAEVWAPSGVPINAQTGTTYTVVATDRASYLSFSNAGAIAVTLPQAGGTGFASNFVFVGCDIGTGTATITPTTSTISYTTGSGYTSAAATMTLATGECALVYSNNTNYLAIKVAGSSGAVTSVSNSDATLTISPTTGAVVASLALGHANTWTATQTFPANSLTLAELPTQANATVLSNVSGGTAVPSANALPTTVNALVKTNTANGVQVASLTTDDGTTSTYTGTGGTKSPAFTGTGTTAGFADYPQGTTSASVAPCNTATSICVQAPTSVTSYLLNMPGAAPTVASFKQTDTCASAVCTETFQPAPIVLTVNSNFVTAANTNLQAITGLSFAGIGSKAFKAQLDCDLQYSQQTAAVADAFGIQDVTTAPNEIDATGFVQTAATTWVDSVMTALTTTTATNIVAMTPSAITTFWHARIRALVDQPSGTASVVQVMVKTGTAADTVTVKRGSNCTVSFQ